ncbi:MAG: hypothetical protein U0Q16_33895 [Bryobacteraceae bacterium]
MDTFLQTTALELRPNVALKLEPARSGQGNGMQPSNEFFDALRGELLKAISPYSEACKAASLAFERVFARFGID